MVDRVLQFYTAFLQDVDDGFVRLETQVDLDSDGLADITSTIATLHAQGLDAKSSLEGVDIVRQERDFKDQVSHFIEDALNSMSIRISTAISSGTEGRPLVLEIGQAAEEAISRLNDITAEVIDLDLQSSQNFLTLVDDALQDVNSEKKRLVALAAAPLAPVLSVSSSGISTLDRRFSARNDPHRLKHDDGTSTLRPLFAAPDKLSWVSSASVPESSVTSSRRRMESVDTVVSDNTLVHSSGPELKKPTWLSEYRIKEDEEEFVASSMNLDEVDRDLRELNASLLEAECKSWLF